MTAIRIAAGLLAAALFCTAWLLALPANVLHALADRLFGWAQG